MSSAREPIATGTKAPLSSRRQRPPRRSRRKSSNRKMSDGASPCMAVLPAAASGPCVKGGRRRPWVRPQIPDFATFPKISEDFIADSLLLDSDSRCFSPLRTGLERKRHERKKTGEAAGFCGCSHRPRHHARAHRGACPPWGGAG